MRVPLHAHVYADSAAPTALGPAHFASADGKEVSTPHAIAVAPDAQAPFYKYTVRVGKLMLDPIIIVDKP